MKRFEEIERRLNAATPGDWIFATYRGDDEYYWLLTTPDPEVGDLLDQADNRELIASAPTDLRYLLDFAKAAKEALEKIDKFEPAFHHTSAEQQDEMRACRDCAAAMERKWPPSGLCDSHYSLLASFEQRNKNERSYQHVHMRRFAREALDLLEGGTK